VSAVIEEHGFVGNVWVRQNWLIKAGDTAGGHSHFHDHVSLLVKGSVEVTVNGGKPKQFKAPTYIVIKKEHRHQIVALEDDTVFYCIFALRDIDGNVIDIYQDCNVPDYGNDSPHYTKIAPDHYWEISE
jgi:quercetin dioxygenase-like cupin family protein